MYAQASPLIHDSRKWTYKYEGGSEEPSLPGTSDSHSFSYSVFDSIKYYDETFSINYYYYYLLFCIGLHYNVILTASFSENKNIFTLIHLLLNIVTLTHNSERERGQYYWVPRCPEYITS